MSGVPRPIVEWAAEAEPGEAPGRVVACDKLGHCCRNLDGGAEDAAKDRLLLQGAEKSLADSVRLWLVWKGVTERHTPVRELAGEGICSTRFENGLPA